MNAPPAAPVSFQRGLMMVGSGSIANLVLLFLETVIATRLLPTSDYGSYVLLITTVNFLVLAVDFGCKLAVTQLIASGDRARQEAIVGSALAFRIAVVVAASAAILAFRGLLVILDPSPDLARYVGYVPLMLATASLDELLFAILQGFQAYRPMTTARIARSLVRVTLTVVLLVVFHAGIAALVYSWSISFGLAILYQYWALPVHRLWGWRWATLSDILRFGFPLLLTRFLGFLSSRLHLALLGVFAGVDSVAFFAVANRIPDALLTQSDSFFRVYFPTMATLIASGRRKAAELLLERSLRLISFSSALAAVGATLFGHEIVTLLFSSRYAGSAGAFALLMIALHMTLLVSVMGYTLTAAGRPGRSLVLDVVVAAASAAGDLLLIPTLGVVGAACASIAGSYASSPISVWLVRHCQLSMTVRVYVKQSLALLVCAALGWWVQPGGLAAGLAYKLAVLAVFVVLSVLWSTITRDDLALVFGDRVRRGQAGLETQPGGVAARVGG